MDNNELDYNENDSENGEESCKLYNLTHFKFNSRNYIDIFVKLRKYRKVDYKKYFRVVLRTNIDCLSLKFYKNFLFNCV